MSEQPTDSVDDKTMETELIVRMLLWGAIAAVLFGLWLGWLWGIGGGIVAAGLAWFVRIEKISPSPTTTNGTTSETRRNHIICLDGTWNLPNVPTNVYKLYRDYLEEDSPKQIKRYYGGVGTRDLTKARSAFVKRLMAKTIFGGATGLGPFGVFRILDRAYFDFAKTYRAGDRIFIFGFSRGAAAARALANYICKTYGLPESVKITYVKSRVQQDVFAKLEVTSSRANGTPGIEFLGLWDTVLAIANPVDRKLEKLDLSIPVGVRRACHLVAIHERRDIFDAKLIDHDARVDEVWFPGWHSNVGGGAEDARLSDITLRYMVARAEELGALIAVPRASDGAQADYGLSGDLVTALWDPKPWPIGNYRQIRVQAQTGRALPKIHESAYQFAELSSLKLPTLPEAPARAQKIQGYGT